MRPCKYCILLDHAGLGFVTMYSNSKIHLCTFKNSLKFTLDHYCTIEQCAQSIQRCTVFLQKSFTLYISTSDHGRGPHEKPKVHVADDLQKKRKEKSDRADFSSGLGRTHSPRQNSCNQRCPLMIVISLHYLHCSGSYHPCGLKGCWHILYSSMYYYPATHIVLGHFNLLLRYSA